MTIFLQMTKRQRLNDDGRRVRQLELKLELARLRCEEASGETSTAGGAGDGEAVQPDPTPPATPQTGPASAPASTTPAAPTTHLSSRARGRGRGGARGGRTASFDYRGLQTVFVCVAHDKIYCQVCNAYERSDDYWRRQ